MYTQIIHYAMYFLGIHVFFVSKQKNRQKIQQLLYTTYIIMYKKTNKTTHNITHSGLSMMLEK